MPKSMFLSFVLAAAIGLPAAAQQVTPAPDTNNPAPVDAQQDNMRVEPMAQTPVYRVNVVERTAKAVDYRHNSESTEVNFKGTSIEPRVDGKATVKGHTGRLAIDAEFHHLQPARTFGPEYLTYVLWAVTPQGRAVNLGEVVPNDDGNARLQLTTDLQEFGLVLTAEPYFAVTRPSDMVVAENIIRSDTKGLTAPIDAKFDLLERGAYTMDLKPQMLPATGADMKHTPVDLLEARNAIAIAQAAGAEQYASDSLTKAKQYLSQAEDYFHRKAGSGPISTVARAAAQNAEDARVLTIRRREEERVAAARKAAEEREQAARDQAEQARMQQQQAEQQAEQARLQAQQEADQRQRAEAQAQQAQQQLSEQTEQARLQQQQAQQQAELARQQAQQAEQERLRAQQQAEQARQQAQQAEQARLQAEQQSLETRQRLVTQLNSVLQTKDTARGVVASMPDVLFDFNKATLRPGARERLAKVAGIILAYPDLKLEIDGHTDSIGSDQYNEQLSQQRADVVRDYLTRQGVPAANIIARGFGKSEPIASNATASGRQLNRRVELVMSGTAIGNAMTPGGVNANASATTTGGVTGAATSTTTTTTTTAPVNGTVAAPASPSTSTVPANSVSGTPAQTTPAQTTPVQTTQPPATVPPPQQGTTPIPPR